MLTRLKVSGFKNLVDVDVRFGPFTCIAGANGSGKSNLFDAIQFLSALADGKTLRDAALSVRSEGDRTGDMRDLFHRIGDQYADEMSFEVEMIVPQNGANAFGQYIEVNHTLFRYGIVLSYHAGEFSDEFSDEFDVSGLRIVKEELASISEADTMFFAVSKNWQQSTIHQQVSGPVFSLELTHNNSFWRGKPVLHTPEEDGPVHLMSHPSVAYLTYINHAMVRMARREMQSWRVMRLEPSALRRPDELGELSSDVRIGVNGAHMPATLYRLARSSKNPEQVYGQVAGRLAELIDDVREVDIDRDDKRALLTLQATDWGGTVYPARALSDGTLRFLALAIMEQDRSDQGVICFEEPENGVSPGRIPAMLRLLQDIATDTDYAVGPDNPLRQVIINTHSPAVVQQVPDDALLMAGLKNGVRDGKRFKYASFSYLSDTWRAKLDPFGVMAKGDLLAYLNPVIREHEQNNGFTEHRVIDRPDLQPYVPGAIVADE